METVHGIRKNRTAEQKSFKPQNRRTAEYRTEEVATAINSQNSGATSAVRNSAVLLFCGSKLFCSSVLNRLQK
jgi:hypothetical protein